MAKYLDQTGLTKVLSKLTEKFALKSEIPEVPEVPEIPEIPSIWTGTRIEYEAISSKDEQTIYMIYE